MLNIDRVRCMTQLAVYEKNELHDHTRLQEYTRSDYVHSRVLIGFITGTIFFAITYALAVAVLLLFVVQNLTVNRLILILVAGLIAYLIYIAFHMRRIGRRAKRRYAEGIHRIAQMKQGLEELQKMYEREDAKAASAPEDRDRV